MGLALVGGMSRGGVMPARNTARMTMYTSQVQNVAAAAANITLVNMRPDALNDPFVTPADAGSPRGFDEWMLLYKLYKVTKAKITVTITVTAGSASELQNIDSNMLLRYAVRATGTVPPIADTLKTMYERQQDRIVRFSLHENFGKIISKTFVIDPYTIVKADAARIGPRHEIGWGEQASAPNYESLGTPNFTVTLYKTQPSFPTNIEVFTEVRGVFEVLFKRPEDIAES